jgi:hypothetical protein
MKGTKFGRMVIPGQPDSSNLYVLISGRAKIQPQLSMAQRLLFEAAVLR